MMSSMGTILRQARDDYYAIGAFNVYNLEGVRAVVSAAERARSPVVIQLLPSAIKYGGTPFVSLCLVACKEAEVPTVLHLDHCSSPTEIEYAVSKGVTSVMADGSRMKLEDNIAFTKSVVEFAHLRNVFVEGEVGRLGGNEDGSSNGQLEGEYTDPQEARKFVAETKVDALAISIGNVHGRYKSKAQLNFDLLDAIRKLVDVPLVLHGSSYLDIDTLRNAQSRGINKFNINLEINESYLTALRQIFAERTYKEDLLEVMKIATSAMREVAYSKIVLFQSVREA